MNDDIVTLESRIVGGVGIMGGGGGRGGRGWTL